MRDSRPYLELLRNFAVDVVNVRTRSRRFLPLMTNLYVTKQCNLRCRYCYPPGEEPPLPVEEMVALLDRIRPGSPALNITGGEPLLYPGIVPVLRRAKALRFRPILLSTNGLWLDRVADELGLVDHVVISLDSLDPGVNEAMTGVVGSTARIIASIENAAALAPRHGFVMTVHAVVSPETMSGIEDILDFCERLGARFTLSPEHEGDTPHPGLVGNPVYRALLDRLAARKASGAPLFCSEAYLRAIRDFSPHGCYPCFAPRVEPDGRVYLPCQRRPARHVYLRDYPSLVELMRREADYIDDPACARRCFLACYIEPERYLKRPAALFENLNVRRALLGR